MKKVFLFAAIIGCVLLSGCGGNSGSGETQQSDTATASTTASEASVPAEESEPVVTTASTSETTTAATTPEESVPEETEEIIDLNDAYAEMITKFDNAYLGLPRADKIYVFKSTGESREIGGQECYGVSCYDEHEGTLYYMCDYYITEDGAAVYRYYLSDDKYVLLPEGKGFSQMNPNTQTPEEIFAVANELYGYFDVCALDVLPDYTLEVEVNGSTWIYYMVADERLDTKAELLSALSCYFSADIVNALMDTQMYREGMDGKLYSTGGARGGNMEYQGTVYELTSLTEDTAAYTAYNTYRSFDTGETYTEEYVYNAVKQDGRWVFTNFDLPY